MISIVTPTHNRVQTLKRLWVSICNQTSSEQFEWLLIDDGSTDGTDRWFEQITPAENIKLHYIYQINQGKSAALNHAALRVAGDWVVIVDSDDALTSDAIETIKKDTDALSMDHDLLGICYRKSHFDGRLVGTQVGPQLNGIMKPNDAGHLFQGDLSYVFRTSALRKHPFPSIPNEKFVPELLIWNQIADSGSIYYFADKAIYRCEYLPDGYSANFRLMLRANPKGFGLFYRNQVARLGLSWRGVKALLRLMQCKLYELLKAR